MTRDEREELALMNVSNFVRFASGKLAPHMVDDLQIVVDLASASLRARAEHPDQQEEG